jgi:hypothetical protein
VAANEELRVEEEAKQAEEEAKRAEEEAKQAEEEAKQVKREEMAYLAVTRPPPVCDGELYIHYLCVPLMLFMFPLSANYVLLIT